ncbi:hypothetical protein Tco_1289424 [Tanacetum coccineum]
MDKKDEPNEVKETPKEWTVEEEIALCQGWCDVSENSISENSMKAKDFEKMLLGTLKMKLVQQEVMTRLLANGKIGVRPRIGVFCAIIKNIEANHESGTNDLDGQGRKKAKTAETTSGSASGGFNLNEEADEAVEETQSNGQEESSRFLSRWSFFIC